MSRDPDGAEVSKVMDNLKAALRRLKGTSIRAVVLFGSRSRGEQGDRSDIDLLVLHDECQIKDLVERRRHYYEFMRGAVEKEFEAITVVDLELSEFLNPREITPLLLNIYWDGIALYDETGRVEDFLRHAREKMAASGLRRVRDEGRAYYWILPKPTEKVEIL